MHQIKPGVTIIISEIAIPLKNKRKTGEITAIPGIVRADVPNFLLKVSLSLYEYSPIVRKQSGKLMKNNTDTYI